MASPFRFKNAALMMALAAAYPIQSYASAGTALFSTSDVTVRRGSATDPLTRGSNLESGDTILTGPAGRAQVRFSDGGLVSLQPNSQFNITRYVDANDAKQDTFLVDLLRGGMRAITGLIGKRNHDNYKVTTTTATIGIRGSAFLLSYLPDGTLVVSTEQDAIEVCTQAGCTGLAAGESARVVNSNEPAVRTSVRATLPVPDPLRTPGIVGDGTTGAGKSNLVSNPPAPAPVQTIFTGMAFVSAGLQPNNTQTTTDQPAVASAYNPLDQRQYLNGTLVTDPSAGAPTTYTAQNNDQGKSTGTSTIIASTGSYATNDLIILGTWSGDTWSTGSGGVGTGNLATTNLSTGFVTGLPTSSSALSSLSGRTGQYNLASATPVYATNGSVGSVTSGALTVDFLGAGNFANLNLTVKMPALTQPVANALVPSADNTIFTLSGAANGTGSGFAGGLSVTSAACQAGQAACGYAIPATGTGYFTGFLSGPNASNAGVSFTANGTSYGNFGGAATFAQSSAAATAVVNNPSSLQYYLMPLDGGTNGSTRFYGYNSFYSGEGLNANFVGNQLTGFLPSTPNNGQSSVAQTGMGSSSYGSVGTPGTSGYIGWGYWAGATQSNNSQYSPSSTALADVHYIVTTPTPYNAMPNTGTANYGLVGGTAPTFTPYSGSSQIGKLVSASMSVNFATSQVTNLNIATQFGSTTVNVAPTSIYMSGSQFASCSGTAVSGVFSGTNAQMAGMSYRTNANIGGNYGNVTGALAMQQISNSGVGRLAPLP